MASSTDKGRESAEAPGKGAAGVVVLGPGRSGTSAIARAFVAAGFFAGEEEDLHGPARTNPLGHFESLAVMEVNEDLLARFDCSWWADAPSADEQLPHREEAAPRLQSVVDSLISSAGGAPVVLKEPRINGLLPLWWPVIDGVLHPVIAIRDPLEVALSHGEMEGTSTVHALAAWEAQMTTVLEQLEGEEATVSPFAQLISRDGTASEIVEAATSRLDSRRAAVVRPGDAGSALRPDLRTQDAARLDHADYLTRRQMLLWDHLRSLPVGRTRLTLPPELRTPSAAARETMRRESERVRLVEAHARMVDALAQADARAVELERRLQGEVASAARHARELADVRESASWKVTAPLRWAKRMLGR
jgi:hypothetical protein